MLRRRLCPEGYGQPEDYGYDFRDWVSPYTKGAHVVGGVALVLQDWAGSGNMGSVDPEVQRLGRYEPLLTNRRLEVILQKVFGVRLVDTYATNAFPYIKQGGISKPVPFRVVRPIVQQLLAKEIEIAHPTVVIALGVLASKSLSAADVEHVPVWHPAARKGGTGKHVLHWRSMLARCSFDPESAWVGGVGRDNV